MGIPLNSSGTSELHAVIGEPGLAPGQAADLEALRFAVVDRHGLIDWGSRGFHAAGLELPGLRRASCTSGGGHPLARLSAGSAQVNGLAFDTIHDVGGANIGWEQIWTRVTGGRKSAGAFSVPSPLDAQTLTLIWRIGLEFWPVWSGWISGGRRTESNRRGSAGTWSLFAKEYSSWLQTAQLDARFVPQPRLRYPQDQEAGARIRQLLEAVGYPIQRLGNIYNIRALVDPGAWDFFCPRRIYQGYENFIRPLTALAVEGAERRSVASYIHDAALAAGGALVNHQGIGPIRLVDGATGRQRTGPDKHRVNSFLYYPEAEVQLDWGGVFGFVKWGTDPDGAFTTGGFETPIRFREEPTEEDWEAEAASAQVDWNADNSVNLATWSREGETLPITYKMNDNGREESFQWARKVGIREMTRTGLPFRSRAELEEVVGPFMAAWAPPRPSWILAHSPTDEGDNHRVAAALHVGHRFRMDADGTPAEMYCHKTAFEWNHETWTKQVRCSPTSVRWSRGRPWPNPPRTADVGVPAVLSPVQETPEDAFLRGDKTAATDQLARFAPRVAYPTRYRPFVYWCWDEYIGDLPILGTRIAFDLDRPGSVQPPAVDIDNPWICHYLVPPPPAGEPQLAYDGPVEPSVQYLTRLRHSRHYNDRYPGGNPSKPDDSNDPPGRVGALRAVWAPGGTVGNFRCYLAWDPPLEAGWPLVSSYAVHIDDLSTPAPGLDAIDAGAPVVEITRPSGAATKFTVRALNAGGGLSVADSGFVTLRAWSALEPLTVPTPDPPSEIYVYRTAAGYSVLWGEAAAGSGDPTPPVTGAQIGYTRRGQPEAIAALTAAQWGTGRWNISETASALDVRMRVRNAAGWGPWSRTVPGSRPAPASQPRNLDLFRTTSGDRQASDGWGAVWAGPASLGNIPQSVSDVRPRPAGQATSAEWGVYETHPDPGAGGDADVLWGAGHRVNAARFADALAVQVRSAAWKTSTDPAREIEGAVAQAALPAVGGLGAVRNLIAARSRGGEDRVHFAFHPPPVGLDGQPYQFRHRVNNGAWSSTVGYIHRNPTSGDDQRPGVPTAASSGENDILYVQTRTRDGAWSPAVADLAVGNGGVRLPARAAQPVRTDPSGRDGDIGAPRNLRAVWFDTSETATSSNTGAFRTPIRAAADVFKSVTLIIMWDEPHRGRDGTAPSNYSVNVSARNLVYSDYVGGGASGGHRPPCWVGVKVDDPTLFTAGFPESPDDPDGTFGPYLLVAVTSLPAVNTDPATLPGFSAAVLYMRAPRLPGLEYI